MIQKQKWRTKKYVVTRHATISEQIKRKNKEQRNMWLEDIQWWDQRNMHLEDTWQWELQTTAGIRTCQ